MGGSDILCYQGPDPDASDPDSDVPDKLRFILATHSDRNSVISFQDDQESSASTSSCNNPPAAKQLPTHILSAPPSLPLPIFHVSLVDDEQNEYDIDESTHTSDEDTKKSFDFTGELKKLNESGASDRRSFVEQLENAFQTPAKVDLCYDFGGHVRAVDIPPPVPNFPLNLSTATSNSGGDGSESLDVGSRLLDVQQPSMLNDTHTEEYQESESQFDFDSGSQLVNVPEPSSHESALSIMSVSSYGPVINSGSLDPVDYGLPSLRESSEDMMSIAMSSDVDDMFAFMENRPRQCVESDASSFYFKAPSSQQHGHSFTRGHRH
jgi:hypothetical protein